MAGLILTLTACNKAKSPEDVQADVAKASAEAAENTAKAEEHEAQQEAEAAQDRIDASAKAADKSVAAVAETAVTQSEGDTKIALAKCNALEGDEQKACRDKAKEHLETVKERAKPYTNPN
jgi:molecular chaperone DnaK (HSP70)